MNTLNNNNSNIVTNIEVSNTTNLENTMSNINLNKTMINTVTMQLMSRLVREELCTPKQAVIGATVFGNNIQYLLDSDSEGWLAVVQEQLADATVSTREGIKDVQVPWGVAEVVAPFNLLGILRALKYVRVDGSVVSIGSKLIKILERDLRATPPTPVEQELVRRRPPNKNHSKLSLEALDVLESTEFTVCAEMVQIARDVYKIATPELNKILDQETYILKGCAKMNPLTAYISEFFGDERDRMYQAAYYGPNGQTSDMSRAMQDLHGVSKKYDINTAITLLTEEIGDMGKFKDNVELGEYMAEACKRPDNFIAYHLENEDSCIKKPWNFVKVSLILKDLYVGKRPYIGVALGYDAKCSGPQLGGFMVACETMLISCGLTRGELTDAYEKLVSICEEEGLGAFTRNGVKKSFMAVFYGSGWAAMMDLERVENVEGFYDTLWTNSGIDLADPEAVEAQAKTYHECVNKAFGAKLRMLRGAVKTAGYDYNESVCKYDKPVSYTMPDGFVVSMDYRKKLNIDGLEILMDTVVEDALVEFGGISKYFEAPTFGIKEYDLERYGRNGFVNLIQATDALIARLIIVHCRKLGVQHIISVHDCFRVNIHDTELLKQAIVNAYLELFGSDKNEPTEYLQDLDILKQYFIGSNNASKDEYKKENNVHVQFYKNGNRILRSIGGEKTQELIKDIDNTQYFGK